MAQMTPNPVVASNRVGILGELVRNAQLTWRLLKDPARTAADQANHPRRCGGLSTVADRFHA